MKFLYTTKIITALSAAAVALSPLAAAAGCLSASSTIEGAINGEGTFTTADGYQITLEQADYTPHGDNPLGFVGFGMGSVDYNCLNATEGLTFSSAAMRLNFSGDQPVTSVKISYCTEYPIINLSAGTEMPPAFHENWKTTTPVPSEIPTDSGMMVQVQNEPNWNKSIYLFEANINLTAPEGLETLLFGMRKGNIIEVCVN